MRIRLCAAGLALILAGCTLNVNNPSVTANTAVGDGARLVNGGSPAASPGSAGASPGAPPLAGASQAPGASASPSTPDDGAPPDPPSAGVRDQQALKTTIAFEAGRDTQIGQTFVPKRSGRLAAIGLRLAARGERVPEATLRLLATNAAGGPTGAPLAEAPIPPGDISPDRDTRWSLAVFGVPISVEAGRKYAWTLAVSGAYPVVVGGGDNRAYEGGEGWSAGGDGAVWNKQGVDFAFRSYMGD